MKQGMKMNKKKDENLGRFVSLRMKITLMAVGVMVFMFLIQQYANAYIAPKFYYRTKIKTMERAFDELKLAAQISNQKYMTVVKKYEDQDNLRFKTKNESLDFGYKTVISWNFRNSSEILTADSINIKKDRYVINPKPTLFINSKGNESLRMRGCIDSDYGRYYVQIAVSPRALQSVMSVMNNFTLFIYLLTTALIAALVYLYMRKLITPLRVMSGVAVDIANQNFEKRIDVKDNLTTDEISLLGDNINKISLQLKNDMEELQKKNLELEKEIAYKNKMEKVRQEFVANVSHELKTPIAILSSYAQMLKYEHENIDTEYYYDILLEETQLMQNKVESLLKLSYIEFDLDKLELNTIDFKELVKNQVNALKVLAEEKEVRLETNPMSGEYLVDGNHVYLESVVENYLTNAIKHTSKGDLVRVNLHHVGDKVRFTVYNEGSKIPDKDMENIWESFYQADKSRSNDGSEGVGLGLFLVKKIVEMHQGTCGVCNLDNGVEFYAELPVSR